MAKKLDLAYEIAADVETVYAVISGEGWAAAKAEEFDDESLQESRTVAAGGAVTLVVSRGLPDGVPGFLSAFLPAGGRAKQTEAWEAAESGARRGTWKGEIPGAPATVGGAMALEPTDGGTRYVIRGEVAVRIPLVGGKAESYILDMIGRLTAAEAELLASLST